MIKQPTPRCINQHPASKFCAQQKCTFNALICQSQQCQSYLKHEDCMMKFQSKTLINKLMKKGESASMIEDPILSLYNYAIKCLNRDKDEYIKLKDDTGFQLGGKEKQLYNLLNQEAKNSEVASKLVFDVYNSLKDQPNAVQNTETKKLIKQYIIKIQNVLKDVKKLWQLTKILTKTQAPKINQTQVQVVQNIKKQNVQDPTNYLFSVKLNDYKQFSITQNCKHARRHKAYDGFVSYLLIEPALSEAKSKQKIVFKICSDIEEPGLYFGACFHNETRKKPKSLAGLNGYTYLVGTSGNTISHHVANQNFINTDFSCKKGSNVVLQYDPKAAQIVIYNTQKQNVKVTFEILPEIPLYACVVMYSLDSAVQILPQ